jgi:hypothetical protein
MATRTAALPGIRTGQLVRIAIPGGERVTASVSHVSDTWLGLRLSGPGSPAARELYGVRAQLEYMVDDGIHRVVGDLEPADSSSPSALRCVLRSAPQLLGRRQHLRAAMDAPAVLTAERTGEKFRGRTVNVSEGGMLVEGLGSGLPRPGARLRFALAPRDARDAVVGTAVVVRTDVGGGGRLALSFERLPRAAADDLARIVFEHMQGARARRG